MRTTSNGAFVTSMDRGEVIDHLKRVGWTVKQGVWSSPHFKRRHQQLTLREAATLEGLTCHESLSQKQKCSL